MAEFHSITIERQYASGGSEIGKLVGEMLGIPCHDHDILDKAAENCNVPKDMVQYAEETSTNILLFGLSMLKPGRDELPVSEKIFAEETKIITDLVRNEKSVIVGRCAGYILKNLVRSLNVYIYADYEKRFDRAISVYGIPDDEAEDVIKKFDKKRSDFYHANTKRKWSDKGCYHLCLNSGLLGTKACAEIIADVYRAAQEK